jgi:hypothetical protein
MHPKVLATGQIITFPKTTCASCPPTAQIPCILLFIDLKDRIEGKKMLLNFSVLYNGLLISILHLFSLKIYSIENCSQIDVCFL